MTLEEVCELWGVSEREVDYVVDGFFGTQYWRNTRTFEVIEAA
jgi:hypothetical protein